MSIGKVYACDLCKKAFSRNGDLTRHKTIHSGVKNYICEICGMRFAQQSGMKTHRNTHTGEKPHACGYCGKSFGDPSSCTRHEKEKHRVIIPFQCHICSSSIVRRSSFARHIREKHPWCTVTKEYLDSIEPPMRAKPKGRGNARRRVKSTPAVTPAPPDSRAIFKVDPPELYRRSTVDGDHGVQYPATVNLEKNMRENVEGMSKFEQSVQRNTDALPFTFGASPGCNYGNSAAVSQLPVSQQHVQLYSQEMQQQEPEPLHYDYGLPSSGGHAMYIDVDRANYDVGSEPSSPEPLTPPNNKTPGFVEPSKINPYDYSLYGTEQQPQCLMPALYSYVDGQQQQQQQRGLLYVGL